MHKIIGSEQYKKGNLDANSPVYWAEIDLTPFIEKYNPEDYWKVYLVFAKTFSDEYFLYEVVNESVFYP